MSEQYWRTQPTMAWPHGRILRIDAEQVQVRDDARSWSTIPGLTAPPAESERIYSTSTAPTLRCPWRCTPPPRSPASSRSPLPSNAIGTGREGAPELMRESIAFVADLDPGDIEIDLRPQLPGDRAESAAVVWLAPGRSLTTLLI